MIGGDPAFLEFYFILLETTEMHINAEIYRLEIKLVDHVNNITTVIAPKVGHKSPFLAVF